MKRWIKGQVSVFLAVGIFMLVFALFFFLSNKPSSVVIKESSDVASPVRSAVQFCLDDSLSEGVKEFGLTGGFPIRRLLRPAAFVNGRFVTLYRQGNQVIDSEVAQYEGYLAQWIAVKLKKCVLNQNIKASSMPVLPDVRVSFLDDKVSSFASFPIKVQTGQNEILVPSDYSSTVNIDVLPFIQEARDWAVDESQHNGVADIFRLVKMKEKGWQATAVSWDNKTMVVLIEDPSHLIGSSVFAFQFATSDQVMPA